LGPGIAGGDVVAERVVCVSEVYKDVCLQAHVFELTSYGQSLVAMLQCRGVVTEMLMHLAEAVKCYGFAAPVAELPEARQGVLGAVERLLVISEFRAPAWPAW
jgi:hypothetical protein